MKQPSLDALPVFRSVMQAQMLGLLLSNPERPWSNKELAERLDAELRTVAKETRRLARAGLLKSESVGKTLLYSAAADSPFYRPLLERAAILLAGVLVGLGLGRLVWRR